MPTATRLIRFESPAGEPNKPAVLIREETLKVLHLTLEPGSAMPDHQHPGQHVVLQALSGAVTVVVDHDKTVLEPGALLMLSGEQHVSPQNRSDATCSLLITLVKA